MSLAGYGSSDAKDEAAPRKSETANKDFEIKDCVLFVMLPILMKLRAGENKKEGVKS